MVLLKQCRPFGQILVPSVDRLAEITSICGCHRQTCQAGLPGSKCGIIVRVRVCVCFTGAFCIPVYIPYSLTGRWMLGKGLCKVWLVMDYLLCSASVFNIVLISYDRFLSVTRAVSTSRAHAVRTLHALHTHPCQLEFSLQHSHWLPTVSSFNL